MEEKTEKLAQLMNQAEGKKQQMTQGIADIEDILAQAEELLDSPEWQEMLQQAHEEQTTLKTVFGDFEITIEQAGNLLEEIEKTVQEYEKMVFIRSHYLEELELGDWSESFKELDGVKERLKEIRKLLELHSDKLKAFLQEKKHIQEQIEHLAVLLKDFNQQSDSLPKRFEIKTDDETEEEGQSDKSDDFKELALQSEHLLQHVAQFESSAAEVNEKYWDSMILPLQQLASDKKWVDFKNKWNELDEARLLNDMPDFIEEAASKRMNYEMKLQDLQARYREAAEWKMDGVEQRMVLKAF